MLYFQSGCKLTSKLFAYIDIQPPDLEYCPTNIRVSSSSQLMFINWTEPKFRDPADHYLDVTANYPTNGSTFTWGDYTVVYNALKFYNGLRTTCSFNITVRRKWIWRLIYKHLCYNALLKIMHFEKESFLSEFMFGQNQCIEKIILFQRALTSSTFTHFG